MSTPITTPGDIVTAAMGIAKDAAEGRLAPTDLEAQLETELRDLVGTVVGEGDPLFALQVNVARGVLAVGGVPTNELAEWLAVARHRAGEPVTEPESAETTPEPVSLPTAALSPESEAPESIPEPEPVAEAVEPAPPVSLPPNRVESSGYDPLAGWSPGQTRRH